MADEKKLTKFESKDIRLLRECLVNIYKKSPIPIRAQINEILLRFSDQIRDRCECEEKSFQEKENRYACLNCGYRHKNKDGDVKVKLVK